MAATPSPNYNDKQFLAADPTFQNRVRQSLLAACVLAKLEDPRTVPFHRERETFIVAVVSQPDVYKVLFADAAASFTAVINDATLSGATPLTSANVAAQAALVQDSNIDAAVSSSFNMFFRTPGN